MNHPNWTSLRNYKLATKCIAHAFWWKQRGNREAMLRWISFSMFLDGGR